MGKPKNTTIQKTDGYLIKVNNMRLSKTLLILSVIAVSTYSYNAMAVAPIIIGAGAALGGALINPISHAIDKTHTGNCVLQQLKYNGTQEPDDNEFLYASKEQFDESNKGYSASGKTNSGNGMGWECDNDACQHNQMVIMPAGHVFKGEVINVAKAYMCDTTLMSFKMEGDHWVPSNIPIQVEETTTNGNGSSQTNPSNTDNNKHMNTTEPYLRALQTNQ